MTVLRSELVLKESKTDDQSSIRTIQLNHRALSDVSCLTDFKNLEKLDLTFNNLISLEGLKSCTNLKWLSVVQNKLESLKGIEGLSKLTVLNAAKNKLRSMDEVRLLVGLGALILNDNEITSICKLDQIKNLNTLVLSRNPIREIGDSLMKVKSIRKLSLSDCNLQSIDSSLKSCVELKELRLAHNDIKNLPDDLAHSKKLQILDLGKNVITRWSDLKVLSSFDRLRNLNLQGNPIVESAKLVKKIRKVLPNLKILNGRPMEKYANNEKVERAGKIDDEEFEIQEQKRGGISDKSKERELDNGSDTLKEKKVKPRKQKTLKDLPEKGEAGEEDRRKDHVAKKNLKHQANNVGDPDMERVSKTKRHRKENKHLANGAMTLQETDEKAEKKLGKKPKNLKLSELDVIDDAEASFAELFAGDSAENLEHENKMVPIKGVEDTKSVGKLVSLPAKRKKTNKHARGHELPVSPQVAEVGLGGQSVWGDE